MNWPEITKDTSLEEVRRIHRVIWQYVVENGYKPDTPYQHNCALCEYTYIHHLKCTNCPAKWKMDEIPYGAIYCGQEGSPYYWWATCCRNMFLKTTGHEFIPYTKTQLAEMIRDIPFKGLDG